MVARITINGSLTCGRATTAEKLQPTLTCSRKARCLSCLQFKETPASTCQITVQASQNQVCYDTFANFTKRWNESVRRSLQLSELRALSKWRPFPHLSSRRGQTFRRFPKQMLRKRDRRMTGRDDRRTRSTSDCHCLMLSGVFSLVSS